jgi:hypothetical protein
MGRLAEHRRIAVTTLNGGPAVNVHTASGELIGAVFVEPTIDGHAGVIRWVRNPTKLAHLR